VRGVDLLIHECNFSDRSIPLATESGHSYASAVGQAAKACGAKRLVLVHIDPQHSDDDPIGIETVRSIFPAAEIGEDLMEIEL